MTQIPEQEQRTGNTCSVCGQSFDSEGERSTHERTAHPGTGSSRKESSIDEPGDSQEKIA